MKPEDERRVAEIFRQLQADLRLSPKGLRIGSIRAQEVIAGILELTGKFRVFYGTNAERVASTDYGEGVLWWTSDTSDLYIGNGVAWQAIGGASGAPPGVHHTTHENTGADELNVAGLSGALADNQPSDHATPIAAHAAIAGAHHAAATAGADGEHTFAGQVLSGVAATAAQAGHATAAQITKLDGIEAAADVTDAANVAAAGAVMGTILDAKGDVIAASAADTPVRVAVGADGQVLTADAASAAGVKWAAGGGGSGTKIEDADADTKVDVEEGADDDTVRIDVGGASAVADAIVITGAGGLVSKVSLIPDSDSAIDLGSSTPKYWANAYLDKIYLNSTATIDGATAGKVTVTGMLSTSGTVGVDGTIPLAGISLGVCPGATLTTTAYGILVNPIWTAGANSVTGYGLQGAPQMTGAGYTGLNMYGLDFISKVVANTGNATFTANTGIRVKPNVAAISSGTITVTTNRGMWLAKPAFTKTGVGVIAITTHRGIDIEDVATYTASYISYGTLEQLRIADATLGTTANRILELGTKTAAAPYLRLLGSTDYEAIDTANTTPLYLAYGTTPTLGNVQWVDPGNGGVNLVAGQKVMVLV
jgi:hypothetical protein